MIYESIQYFPSPEALLINSEEILLPCYTCINYSSCDKDLDKDKTDNLFPKIYTKPCYAIVSNIEIAVFICRPNQKKTWKDH